MIALQNLNATEANLQTTQNNVSTGLSVNSAKDNASVWAIAQGQRADINALDAVTMSLNRATSISDVASTAGQSVSDLLTQVKAKVVAAMDGSLDTASRKALNNDFTSILNQINDVINNASFDGANILERLTAEWFAIPGPTQDGSSTITLSGPEPVVGRLDHHLVEYVEHYNRDLGGRASDPGQPITDQRR